MKTRSGFLTAILAIGLGPALAASDRGRADGHLEGRFCSATAAALFRACGFEGQDDDAKAAARCINVSNEAARAACFAEARNAGKEHASLCRAQLKGRLEACQSLGEGRYDPDFDRSRFDDPKNPTNPNPYFPLGVGHRWVYEGAGEVNTLEVLDETKRIAGVDCIVVRDRVTRDGLLAENTDDWFAPAKDGNVWYCGEEVKNFETFDGDAPKTPELVSIDGSFKAGRNRDKPGVIFQAAPEVGQSYLEEFSLGNAEDVTDVLSTTYTFGSDPALDELVPAGLATLLCSGDCVVTKNFSLLEPGIFALKYHARGIGVFLEVKPEAGEVVQLVSCNFDARCSSLPRP